MAGDRLSFATAIEKVNGNAFAQINVALWYCHRATGDALQKERFETFWQRWTTEGWGPGSGLSFRRFAGTLRPRHELRLLPAG